MKISKYYKGFIAIFAIMSGVAFASCEDQPDKYEVAGGTPVVKYVRCLSTEIESSTDTEDTQHTNGQLVTGASPQSIVCLVGENLRSVYELYFNDQKAILNTSYITDNTLLVQVPRSVPDLVSDKIFMITADKDTVDFDFKVVIPAPSISSMSCEYAQPGSKATLYGDYIVDDPNVPLQIIFPDGQVITDYSVNAGRNAVTFTVPDCTEEGALTVTSIYGTSTTVFHYRDTRGMMFDFDGATGLGNHGWHDRTIASDNTSVTGNFVQLGDGATTMTADGGWVDSQFAFEYWCGSWDSPQNVTSGDGIALHNLVDFTDYAKMALKFEMYIPSASPWSAGAMQICFAGYDRVTYSGNPIAGYSGYLAGANAYVFNGDGDRNDGAYGRAMYRPWTTSGSYDTGDQWVTVTIPLTNFTYDRTGGTAETVPSSPEDFASLTIFVVGGGVNGTDCTPVIKIDNIRAVPNK